MDPRKVTNPNSTPAGQLARIRRQISAAQRAGLSQGSLRYEMMLTSNGSAGPYAIPHNLGTQANFVKVWPKAGGTHPDFSESSDDNTTWITFAVAPPAGTQFGVFVLR